MKKLLTITAVGALLTAPAIAVQKCVALGADYECITAFNGPGEAVTEGYCQTVDYSKDDPYGPMVDVAFIGMCSVTAGGGRGAVARLISTGNFEEGAEDRYHCWCKMIKPMVSEWVYESAVTEYGDANRADSCAIICSDKCSNFIYGTSGRPIDVFFNNPG